jgi:hypothetical protein
MEARPTPDILQAAVEEEYRLEAALRSHPIFQRLEAVRRVIEVYRGAGEILAAVDQVAGLSGDTIRADPVPTPDPPATSSLSSPPTQRAISPPSHSSSAPLARFRRGGWTRTNSQTSQIRAGAEEHFRKTGKRASGPEIYKALMSKGIEVYGRKPATVVAAALTSSPIFDRTPEGYGLREWSNGGAAAKSPSR